LDRGRLLDTLFGRILHMPRTFAYLRVSTTGQTTDNQLQEIAAAGFKVEPRRVITETVSGNVATADCLRRCGAAGSFGRHVGANAALPLCEQDLLTYVSFPRNLFS